MKPWLITFLAFAHALGPVVGFCVTWHLEPHDCTGPFTAAEQWAYTFVSCLLVVLVITGWTTQDERLS